ncbi:MAG TPA: glycolate oxidase subunit GlcF [Steroidobacteraceae bacterium]
MRTALADFIKDTPEGREAQAILRSCVHCGFCLPSCPTYQLLGDELDGPRGRIYLMKGLLEGEPVTARTQLHLDRCLTCRACETACPSGVQYGRLLDIGRAVTEERVTRSSASALKRYLLRKVLPHTHRVRVLLGVARIARALLPRELAAPLSAARAAGSRAAPWPAARHARRVLLLPGCVQPALRPAIDAAAAQVLDRVGISAIAPAGTGCCGALAHHLSAHQETLQQVRRNVDTLWPHIEAGAEAVVLSASACASMLTEYGRLLRDDPDYAARAARVSALAKDIAQVVGAESEALAAALQPAAAMRSPTAAPAARVAFHAPCTLQHALKVSGTVEALLSGAGFDLTQVTDHHQCCGSAGTYSILQPQLSARLLRAKVAALEAGTPDLIATANIGCLTHIGGGTSVPVCHWVELLAQRLQCQE